MRKTADEPGISSAGVGASEADPIPRREVLWSRPAPPPTVSWQLLPAHEDPFIAGMVPFPRQEHPFPVKVMRFRREEDVSYVAAVRCPGEERRRNVLVVLFPRREHWRNVGATLFPW